MYVSVVLRPCPWRARVCCLGSALISPRWQSMSDGGLAVSGLCRGMARLLSSHQASGVALVPWKVCTICWLSCAACAFCASPCCCFAFGFCHLYAFGRCAGVTMCMLNERIIVHSINSDSLSVQTDTRPTQAVAIDSTIHTPASSRHATSSTSRASNLRSASAAGARTAEEHCTSSRQQQR